MDTKLKKSRKLKNFIIALIVLIPALILVCLYPQMERAMLDKKEQWLTDWEEQKEAYEQEQSAAEKLSEILIGDTPTMEVALETEVTVDHAGEVTVEMNESAATETPIPEEPVIQYYVQDDFVNYAVEASYYQYAMLLQEATGRESFTEVLDAYGWINDFYELTEITPYYARYTYQDENGEDQVLTMSKPPKFSSEAGLEKLALEGVLDTVVEAQMTIEGYLGYLLISYDSYGKLADIRMHVDKEEKKLAKKKRKGAA